jgi:hypothetical protein
MGIHVYLDEGTQVGVNDQPMWYGGLLYVFSMGPYQIRADLDHKIPLARTFQQFDSAVARLQKSGGGLISTVYHPTEFVHTEFWDAVNFANRATRPRDEWKLPNRRDPQEAERCFRVLHDYVEHAKSTPNVRSSRQTISSISIRPQCRRSSIEKRWPDIFSSSCFAASVKQEHPDYGVLAACEI